MDIVQSSAEQLGVQAGRPRARSRAPLRTPFVPQTNSGSAHLICPPHRMTSWFVDNRLDAVGTVTDTVQTSYHHNSAQLRTQHLSTAPSRPGVLSWGKLPNAKTKQRSIRASSKHQPGKQHPYAPAVPFVGS